MTARGGPSLARLARDAGASWRRGRGGARAGREHHRETPGAVGAYCSLMVTIILEGVLFVAFLAIGGALFIFVVRQFTPLGLRVRQAENRRRIERVAERRCPIHGVHDEGELVRLPTGERICPACFTEAVHGDADQ